MNLTPELTWALLMLTQTLHLLHHRLAKRHISFAEVLASAVLCVPPGFVVPAPFLMGTHLLLVAVQMVGSLFIRRLSPEWDTAGSARY